MNKDIFNANNKHFNRKIINAFWLIGLIALCAEIVALTITSIIRPENVYSSFMNNTVQILSFLLIILLIIELIYKRVPSFEYFFIYLSASAAVAAIIVYPTLSGIQNLLYFTIIGSAFHFDKKKIIFASILSIVLLMLMYTIYEPLREHLRIYDILLSVTVFLVSMVLSLAVMTKGLVMLKDLEESVEEKQQLQIQNIITERLAKIDALTGLYNHKTFHEFSDYLIEQSNNSNTPMAMAIIDIDNFKSVNDSFGHWVGDIVLRKVAECITQSIHSNDFGSRYGGEEFAILIIDHPWEVSYQVVENIRACISKIKVDEIKDRQVTVSIGIRPFYSGMSKEEWFTSTDQCLYQAKKTGKNKVVS